jgi:hypothetical protein
MNSKISFAAATLVLAFGLGLGGCAAQNSYRLEAQQPEGVKVLAGTPTTASVVMSDSPASTIVVTPKEDKKLTEHSELWFNLVAINKDTSPVDFSIRNVRATVNGVPAKIPNSAELEKLLKAMNMKARALAWGSVLVGTALVASGGGDVNAYTQSLMPALFRGEQAGRETTAKLLDQYKSTVLKPQTIASNQHNGGMVRIIPETPIADAASIGLSFNVGAESHYVNFIVRTENKKR